MKAMLLMTKTLLRVSLLLITAGLVCTGSAWAQTYATVQSLTQPDARGRWVEVDATAAAARIRSGERTPLSVGLELMVGDQIETAQARVKIALEDNEHLTISEGADLTLGDRGVMQRLGEVYYQVRDVFRVDYGTVQTAVEGTEFSIDGTQGPVRVSVTEGAVRVSSAGETVRVKSGQTVQVAQSAAPGSAVAMGAALKRSVLSRAWALGRPRLQVGVMGGGGILQSSPVFEGRLFAAIPLVPGMSLVAQTGLGTLRALPGSRVPLQLGLETTIGGMSFGGSGQATVERWNLSCGARHLAVHLGGFAHARYNLPLSRRLFAVGASRIGHNGDAFESSILAGLGVNL